MHIDSRLPIYAFASALVAGCSASTSPGIACTANFVYGITVNVRDSASGASLGGAHGAVHDGAYVDSLRPYASAGYDVSNVSQFSAAGERAGTYTVEVARAGYRPFSLAGVVVTRDACHVHPQSVTALLATSG